MTKRTEEELKVLFDKFDHDMEKRSRFIRLLLVIDQFFNVLLWNGSQDETISSHLYRRIHIKKNATWFDKLICKFLGLLDTNHCHRARGE